MNPEPMAVVLFPNTQTAIQAERIFQAAGIEAKLIPTPRHLSTTCGLALRFPSTAGERVRQLLEDAGITHGDICEL